MGNPRLLRLRDNYAIIIDMRCSTHKCSDGDPMTEIQGGVPRHEFDHRFLLLPGDIWHQAAGACTCAEGVPYGRES